MQKILQSFLKCLKKLLWKSVEKNCDHQVVHVKIQKQHVFLRCVAAEERTEAQYNVKHQKQNLRSSADFYWAEKKCVS